MGKHWLNCLYKQPDGFVRPVVIYAVTKIMTCGTTLMGYTCWLCSDPGCSHTKKSVTQWDRALRNPQKNKTGIARCDLLILPQIQ
ncbi:hypothetical protein CGA23_26920 (plasmid) [Salmonella enterica subsp. enterica]|nr:hypothetical protein CGA23_26920 [Salmonella enterica subsp. enterica]